MAAHEDGLLPWLAPPPAISVEQIAPLIERCLAGDEAAHARLYQALAAPIYRLCLNLLGQPEDAEEVLQDTFEYAFRRLETFDARKSAFKTWLYRIAISRCRNKRRRKWLPTLTLGALLGGPRSDGSVAEPADRHTPSPAEAVQSAEAHARVCAAIDALSPKLREVAVLRYFEGLAYAEIGELLAIPPKTAESRMRLAHGALRAALADLADAL